MTETFVHPGRCHVSHKMESREMDREHIKGAADKAKGAAHDAVGNVKDAVRDLTK